VLEAMHTGLPVIVSSNVGAKDIVKFESDGWIFPAGSMPALKARMLQAWNAANDLRQMGQNASNTAAACTWPHYRQEVALRLRRLLSAQQPSMPGSGILVA
jgi:glycosyltransferase involved in cell wall biosynthesis